MESSSASIEKKRASQYVDAAPVGGRKMHKKRILYSILAVAAVIAIALGVGLGVGLTRNNSSSDSDSGSSSNPNSTTPTLNETSIAYNISDATSTNTWQPAVNSTWQIILLNALNTTTLTSTTRGNSNPSTNPSVSIYDLDLFTNPASIFTTLHASPYNARVICYFSAGSYEPYRPDSSLFKTTDYGKELVGWPGEYWLNTSSTNVRRIMLERLDLAVTKGCDGVDPDNVDGFSNDNGLNLTEAGAVEYMAFLAASAHTRGLSIGLKNAGDIVNQTLDMMQWQVNEQCSQYDECDVFQPFIEAGKPVFHIEYPSGAPSLTAAVESERCAKGDVTGFSTVLKKMDLDEWVYECPDS